MKYVIEFFTAVFFCYLVVALMAVLGGIFLKPFYHLFMFGWNLL